MLFIVFVIVIIGINAYNLNNSNYFNDYRVIDNIVLYNNINFSVYSNISYYKVYNYSLTSNNYIMGEMYYKNTIELEILDKIITDNYIITKSKMDINISRIINMEINDNVVLKENNNINFNNDIYNYVFFSKNVDNNFDIIILVIWNYFDSEITLKQTKCNEIKYLRTVHNNCFDSYKSIVLEEIPQKYNIHNHFIKTSFEFATSYSIQLI